MAGVDKVYLQQQQKKKENEKKIQSRRRRSEMDKNLLLTKAVLEIESSNSEKNLSESDDEDPGPSTKSTSTPAPPPRKRGRQIVVSPQLAAMLDRNLLSDKAAMIIIFESSRALGQDPEMLALNRSTIRRRRQQHREATATGIVAAFNPNTFLTVLWDDKLMLDLTGKEMVDRLPILVSTMGKRSCWKFQRYLPALVRLRPRQYTMPSVYEG